MNPRYVFLTLFIFLFCNDFKAQLSAAKISIHSYRQENDYSMYFLKENDTIYKDSTLYDFYLDIDSLQDGTYSIEIHSNETPSEKIFTKKYELTSGDTSIISINLSLSERKTGPNDVNENTFEGQDIQFTSTYHDNTWTKETNLFTKNFSFKQDYNIYQCRNKTALIYGTGYEYQRNTLNKDTSLFTLINNDTITKEFYHQFTINYHAKVRIFTGKLQTKSFNPKLYLDLGLAYYFPIFKRHVAEFNNELKFVEKHIGIPNDLRIFVNLGWHPVSLFASYRIFNSFQSHAIEATKYQFGLTFTLAGE